LSFRERAEDMAVAWKRDSPLLPDEARVDAPYFNSDQPSGHPSRLCLPVQFAALNLLPKAREIALERFERDQIRWHAQTPAGPSNHLLDSQVQCVNALAPLVTEPDAIQETFGTQLDIAEVLPFEPDCSEHPGKPRTRGAHTTSVDAAFRYRTPNRSIEIALCEWKYTEHYDGQPLAGGDAAMATRIPRYRPWWDDPHGPIRQEVIPYDDLFVEPFYQLFRQQLLAHEMERTHELGADCVRVLYAAPAASAELWASMPRESHVAAGADLRAAWTAALRHPDRFQYFDTTALVSRSEAANPEFIDRYGVLFRRDSP
jgi:GNAT superfamily N-acetyltransferase